MGRALLDLPFGTRKGLDKPSRLLPILRRTITFLAASSEGFHQILSNLFARSPKDASSYRENRVDLKNNDNGVGIDRNERRDCADV